MLKEARQIAGCLVNADDTAGNPVHPMRWPGTWHLKAAPRLARIVTLNIGADVDLTKVHATLSEISIASGIELRRCDGNRKLLADDIRDVEAALREIPNNDEEWSYWKPIIMLAMERYEW